MMAGFNVLQAVGFYGFANWVPTLLVAQGITVTASLAYTAVIALAAPVGPLIGLAIADRFERKHVIVAAALVYIACGLLFAQARDVSSILVLGIGLTLASNVMSYSFHAYQAELFPTGIRARAVGFVYAWSRFSAIFTGFLIAFVLREAGAAGVFLFISAGMLAAGSSSACSAPAPATAPWSASAAEAHAAGGVGAGATTRAVSRTELSSRNPRGWRTTSLSVIARMSVPMKAQGSV